MTPQDELNFFLKRHNAVARNKALTSAGMALFAWTLFPAILSGLFYLISRIVLEHGALPPPWAWSAFFILNAVVALWRILWSRYLNYDSHGNLMHLLFWPAYMLAECVNQLRQLARLSNAQRAVAQFFMVQIHLAGPDGFEHEPMPDNKALLEKLEEIGAIRIHLARGKNLRLTRRNPDANANLPTHLLAADRPPIALIAGGGALPLLQAQGMRAAGRRIVGIGLKGQYDPALIPLCHTFTEASPLRPGAWVRICKQHGAFEAVMVGHVAKTQMHNPLEIIRHLPDLTALNLWFVQKRHDRRSQGLLFALAESLKSKGLLLMSTTEYIPEHLATVGNMTRRQIDDQVRRDIKLALPILRQLNQLDIGQGLCVKAGDVIALEAMEGTDRMIARAGDLCPRGGWTLVKGANPDKDPRFDVPTIGVKTIENLKQAGAGALVVVASRTIFINKPEVLAAAEKAGIAVVGVELD